MEANGVSTLAGLLKDRSSSSSVLAIGGQPCADAAAAASWLADYIVCPSRDGNRWVPVSVAGHALPKGVLRTRALGVAVATGKGLSPSLDGWRLGQEDDTIARYAIAALGSLNPTVTIISFPELAQLGQYLPTGSRQDVVASVLAGIDRDIGRIMDKLRARHRLSGTAIVVTSGEAISQMNDTVSRSALDQAIVTAGGQSVYVQGGGAAFIGVGDVLQAQPVAQALQAEHLAGVDAVYYKEQAGKKWSYHLQYVNPLLPNAFVDAAAFQLAALASDTSADVIAVYAPHVGTGKPAVRGHSVTGSSGGFQWDEQHIPLIFSGAGFTPGTSTFPARLVDIAPTIERVLGLQPARLAGVVLADALLSPAGNDGAVQAAVGSSRGLLVGALKQRMSTIG
jgi:hypothetical protein